MRVRWDRVGRIALLLLLAAVVALYVQPARSLRLDVARLQRQAAGADAAAARARALLSRRARALREPRTIETEARRLGMVRPGERPYVVSGLPDD